MGQGPQNLSAVRWLVYPCGSALAILLGYPDPRRRARPTAAPACAFPARRRLAATLGRRGQSEDLGVPFITADQGISDQPAPAPDDGAPTLADDLLTYEPHH